MDIPIVAVVTVWQIGWMPASDVVLLPLCIGLALIGVIVAGVAWRQGSRGRVLQGVGLALAPVALYFTGLLRLVWDAVVALVNWAGSIIFSPSMWFGISLLGLCLVLWVVGGLLIRRGGSTRKAAAAAGTAKSAAVTAKPEVGTGRTSAKPAATKAAPKGKTLPPEVDPELAEIEAILKHRGIN